MANAFVPLATRLRGESLLAEAPPPPKEVGAPPARIVSDRDISHDPVADLLGELARLRLAALEALELDVRTFLERLANDVLARELALAPPAIDALVSRALATFRDEQPIAIVVGPDAKREIRSEIPVRVDPTFLAGDFAIEVRHGAFESTLTFRFSEAFVAASNGDVRA